MVLVSLLFALVVFAVILWLINDVLPIRPDWLRTLCNVLAGLILILYIFNLMGYGPGLHFPR